MVNGKLQYKRLIVCSLSWICSLVLAAQSSFRSPLDIPLEVSGTYCELRSNHFHAGLDFRTQQREGLRIYAIEDGYVSRIKVSHFGYGKALYVTHPNGYTSVYAHISEFSVRVDDVCWLQQKLQESYEVDFYLTPDQLPVKKGEVIAYSGNTGGSQGPHLHFEIRDTQTEENLNPLAFGFKVADSRPPVFTGIQLYQKVQRGQISQWQSIDGSYRKITWKKGVPSFTGWSSIHCSGEIGVGIEVFDQQDASSMKNGIYTVSLQMDSVLVYKLQFDRMRFDELRFINAHLDYAQTIRTKQMIQRLFVLPNDSLRAYQVSNTGLRVKPNQSYKLLVHAVDYAGNSTRLPVQLDVASVAPVSKTKPDGYLVYAKKGLDTLISGVSVQIPSNSLYEDTYLDVYVSNSYNNWGFPDFVVGHPNIPIHRNITLAFPLKKESGISLSKYAVMYGKRYYGGKYSDGTLQVSVNDFGSFTIVADTTAPVVTSTAFKDSVAVKFSDGLRFTVRDDLSGIRKYKLRIDGQWALLQYEYKLQQLSHKFRYFEPGYHTLELEVEDDRGNVFYRKWILQIIPD